MPKKKTTLDEVITNFNSAWEYTQSSWHKRWEDSHRLYNNNRVKYGYEGITDTFVPMAFSTVETLTAGLFGSKPRFNFDPPHEKQAQPTEILNALLDYYWDKDQWSLKTINTGRGMFKLGTAVDYFYWESDHPCLINVPISDFFIDPTATCLDDARFCGRRYLTTIEELRDFEVVDLEAGEDEFGNFQMKKKYNNLDKIKSGAKGENTDKEEKDMWYGSTLNNAKESQVEVIEYWTKDVCVSVANRSTVIEDSENYFKQKDRANGSDYPEGLLPFADARDYTDESLFYAKGEIDIIADQQELLNDLTNQNIDSITYTLNQMYTLDPSYAHLINEIENIPGAIYPVPQNALLPIPQRSIPPDAFNERLNIKNEIRETTASNEVVKGVGTQQTGDATATEINAQIAGASQRLSLKVTQIENGYFYRVAKIVFRMVQLYVTEPMMIKIIGKDGVKWEEFDPSEFDGDYEPRIQLETSLQYKKQQESMDAKELLAAFLNDPDVNQQELKKLVLTKSFDLDPDEVDRLMEVPQGMEQGMEDIPEELLEGELLDQEVTPEMLPAEVPLELPPELEGLI